MAVLLLSTFAFADASESDLPFFERPDAIRWGVPRAGDRVNAVLFAEPDAAWDVIELTKAIDCELTILSPENVAEGEDLGDTDVFLLGAMGRAELSETTQAQIAARVVEGAGVVVTRFVDSGSLGDLEEWFDEVVREESADPVTGGLEASTALSRAEVTLYRAGNGRIAVITYPDLTPKTQCLTPPPVATLFPQWGNFDTALALPARAVRWAAGHETPLATMTLAVVAPEQPSEDEIPPDLPTAELEALFALRTDSVNRTLRIDLGRPVGSETSLRVQVRQPDRGIPSTVSTEIRLAPAERLLEVHLPAPPGASVVDAWLLDRKGRVRDWSTHMIECTGWPVVLRLESTKTYLRPNDELVAVTEISAQPHRKSRGTVYTRLLDMDGGVVAEAIRYTTAAGGTVESTLRFADARGRLLRLETFALEGRRKVIEEPSLAMASYAYKLLPVKRYAENEGFAVVRSLDAAGEFGAWAQFAAARQQGVDAVGIPVSAGAAVAAASEGLRPIFELDAVGDMLSEREQRRLYDGSSLTWAFGDDTYVVPEGTASLMRQIERSVYDPARTARVGTRLHDVEQARHLAPGIGVAVVAPDLELLDVMRDQHRRDALFLVAAEDDEAGREGYGRWLAWRAAMAGAHGIWWDGEAWGGKVFQELRGGTRIFDAGVGELLREASVVSPQRIGIEFAKGASFDGDFGCYTWGGARILLALGKPGESSAEKAKFRLTDRAYVYEPVDKPGRGRRTRKLDAKLDAGEAGLWVVLPYRVESLALDVPESVGAGRRLPVGISVTPSDGNAGDHLVRVSLVRVRERERSVVTAKTVLCENGMGETYFPLVFNQRPGDYVVECRDVLTGTEGSARCSVGQTN